MCIRDSPLGAQKGLEQGDGHNSVIGEDDAHPCIPGIGLFAFAIEDGHHPDDHHKGNKGKPKGPQQSQGLFLIEGALLGGDEHGRGDDIEQQSGKLTGAAIVQDLLLI